MSDNAPPKASGNDEKHARSRENIKMGFDAAAIVFSAAAILLSTCSIQEQRRLTHETASQTLIHDQYELCRVLDQLRVEHPEVSHVLALPAQGADARGSKDKTWANYGLFKKNVRALLSAGGSQTNASSHRLYLQEHAMALHVFDIYEQTLLQRGLATTAGDTTRSAVLSALAEYYEGRLLRNPRLRFHWDNGGSDMMEDSTRLRYDTQVRKKYIDVDYVDTTSPLESY